MVDRLRQEGGGLFSEMKKSLTHVKNDPCAAVFEKISKTKLEWRLFEVFRDRKKACCWLNQPNKRLIREFKPSSPTYCIMNLGEYPEVLDAFNADFPPSEDTGGLSATA